MENNKDIQTLRQPEAPEQELIRLAQSVIEQTRSLVLPHHFELLRARRVTFDEVKILKNSVVAIDRGIFKTHILLLSHADQRVVVNREQSMQDTVIVDLSSVAPTLEAMRHFLLETEEGRYWHHAPKIVINLIKKRPLR